MDNEMFDELLASVKEMDEIVKRKKQPSRTFNFAVPEVKHIINYLKPNAIVAFEELDLTFYRSFTNPDMPLFNQLAHWGIEIFELTGANVKIGMELSRIFVESGLNSPKLDFAAPAGCDEHWSGYQYLQDSFQSLAPLLEEYELVSIDELNANTLAERLKNEALTANHPLILTPHVSACSQMTA